MVTLDSIREMLAECTDTEKVCGLRDKAEAIRYLLKTAGTHLEFLNRAAETKLRCERRIGCLLSEFCPSGGDRKSEDRDHGTSMEELGITPRQSSCWRYESLLPEEEFVRYVQKANEEGRELTSQGLLRLARLYAPVAVSGGNGKEPFNRLISGLKNLTRQQKRFATIYADPPWCLGKTEITRLPKRLCNLPVKQLVAQQAHLHLWVPVELLEAGLTVLRAWGFRYQSMLVRHKAPLDYGDYWRQEHDLLLLGVRGRLAFRDSSLPSWLDGWHRSPTDSDHEVCAFIARVSPAPYLDLFATTVATDWPVPQ
jgi:hypothetical protein